VTSSSRPPCRKLTGIEASGAGDIDADGIDADAFEVRSDGSADIALEGTLGRLALDLDGSGDVRYRGDPALTQHVDGSGELTRAD
jgi:hypothetical protein